MKFLPFICALFFSTLTYATECKGDVKIPNTEHTSFAYISFDEIKVGKIIQLASPILSDVTMSVGFKIVSVQFLPSFTSYLVREVIAVSANTGSGDVMIFNHAVNTSNNEILISNFKGFEDTLPYGPAELNCL